MLAKVEGQWLEIETDFLFADQFNTGPIPGVSENGMRIMAPDVEILEGDIRPGRIFDSYTNKHHAADAIPAECLTPERLQYLEVFTPYPAGRGVHMLLKPYQP